MEFLIIAIVILVVAVALMAGGVMLIRSRQPGRFAAPPEAPPAPPAPGPRRARLARRPVRACPGNPGRAEDLQAVP